MHATLVVLIDREREEQKNNDITTGRDLTNTSATHIINTEANAFMKAYNVCLKKSEFFFF
jgi:hypothetical protein